MEQDHRLAASSPPDEGTAGVARAAPTSSCFGNRVDHVTMRRPVKPGQARQTFEYVLGHIFRGFSVAKKAIRQPKDLASEGRQQQADASSRRSAPRAL